MVFWGEFFQSVKEPPNRQNAIFRNYEIIISVRDGGSVPQKTKNLAVQDILTYCSTLPSRVSTYTSGSRCLSLVLL